LYKNEMILFGTCKIKVEDLRAEYEALLWIKAYMPHRHWMIRNNLDIAEIPDEIEYQRYEAEFKFNQRRQ